MEMEQSVPKSRHIKFRRRGITQKKAYNIQNTANVCIVVSEQRKLKTTKFSWSREALSQYQISYVSVFL